MILGKLLRIRSWVAIALGLLPGIGVAQAVRLTNVTRGGTDFLVGDQYRIDIDSGTALAYRTVSVLASKDGVSLGGWYVIGQTDMYGKWGVSGTMDSSTVGQWNETWAVANIALSPVLTFNVNYGSGPICDAPTIEISSVSASAGRDANFLLSGVLHTNYVIFATWALASNGTDVRTVPGAYCGCYLGPPLHSYYGASVDVHSWPPGDMVTEVTAVGSGGSRICGRIYWTIKP